MLRGLFASYQEITESKMILRPDEAQEQNTESRDAIQYRPENPSPQVSTTSKYTANLVDLSWQTLRLQILIVLHMATTTIATS